MIANHQDVGHYVGSIEHLKGKRALLIKVNDKFLRAQFDDIKLVEAFGWRDYPYTDFVAEPGPEDHLDRDGNYWRVEMPPRELFKEFVK